VVSMNDRRTGRRPDKQTITPPHLMILILTLNLHSPSNNAQKNNPAIP
jgi:hypothetical protein